jgi:predicted nucleotidyltransferase
VVGAEACRAALTANEALPDSWLAIYLAGSLVRGWGNPKSDLDVYVITAEPWQGGRVAAEVSVTAGVVPVNAFYVGDRRWDVEFWADRQVDQLLEYAAWDKFESGASKGSILSATEIAFANRLSRCQVIDGADWVSHRAEQFAASAMKSIIVAEILDSVDGLAEDAVGMAEAGDYVSATIAARYAFEAAVDALLASLGDYERQIKWRGRRLLEMRPAELPFDKYWQIETMRDFDLTAPEKWIHSVLQSSQEVAQAVSL